jgi:hypothetical protein
MGLRGELFSTRVILQNRTYFFNVKENRTGDLYLNIVESKNRDTGGFDRQSVILFADDLQEFLKGFDESLRVLEKETRERRRFSRMREAKNEATGEKDDKPDRGGRDNRKAALKGIVPKDHEGIARPETANE